MSVLCKCWFNWENLNYHLIANLYTDFQFTADIEYVLLFLNHQLKMAKEPSYRGSILALTMIWSHHAKFYTENRFIGNRYVMPSEVDSLDSTGLHQKYIKRVVDNHA